MLSFESQYTSALHTRKHRNAVDLYTLESLLRAALAKGKKRAAESDGDEPRPRKRARLGTVLDPQIPEDSGMSESIDDETEWVYRHIFRLHLISSVAPQSGNEDESEDDDVVNPLSMCTPRRELEERIALLLASWGGGRNAQHDIDLGEVRIEASRPSRRGATPSIRVYSLDASGSYIARLPELADGQDGANYDLRAAHLSHLLFAFEVLSRDGRADITAHLYVDVHDPAVPASVDGMLPIALRLEVKAAFVYSKMLQPLPPLVNGRPSEAEEAQRRILLQFFPNASSPPSSFRGMVDIPLLYSILEPAPRLSAPQQELMQPEELIPTLLPFQRRSVAWMLSREGKVMNADGTIANAPTPQRLPLFWDEVETGGKKLYLNRVRGMLLREKPQDSADCLGGILAEEPGLGKTLECIALILLNPSVGRGPTNKRWDPEAKVHVKEIKVSDIIHFLCAYSLTARALRPHS